LPFKDQTSDTRKVVETQHTAKRPKTRIFAEQTQIGTHLREKDAPRTGWPREKLRKVCAKNGTAEPGRREGLKVKKKTLENSS